MRIRSEREAELGAESLEFLGLLPLLMLVILLGWQGLATLRQYGEAQADAQVLARSAAICDAAPLRLGTVDAAAGPGATATVTTGGDYVTASVVLQPYSVFTGINLRDVGFPVPSSRVVMRHEPC